MSDNNNLMKEAGANILIVGHRCYRCSHEWVSSDKNNIPKVCPSCKSPYWDRPRIKPQKNNKNGGKKKNGNK